MNKIKILEEKENPLFNRNEVILEITNEVVPSNKEVEKLISEKFSSNPQKIKIKKIEGRFGSKNFKIIANIYSSENDKNNIEIKTKKQRDAEKKAAEEERKKAKEEKKKAEEEKIQTKTAKIDEVKEDNKIEEKEKVE